MSGAVRTTRGANEPSFEKVVPSENFAMAEEPQERGNFRPKGRKPEPFPNGVWEILGLKEKRISFLSSERALGRVPPSNDVWLL